ncbi:MAG: hypothetical protein K4571_16225 [Deltaproteobacteria bacterium]
MKKAFLFFVFCLAVMTFFYTGCSIGTDPQKVISMYLDDLYHGNSEKAYSLLSSRDKAVRSLQEFSGGKAESNAMRKAFSNKITFKIKDVKITGDKALARVDVTAPDLSGAIGEVFATALSQAFVGSKPDDKAMEKTLTEKMKENNLPTTTTTEQFDLVKEADGWRVYMGWENEQKIKQLMTEAEKFDKQKKFTEAKSKYSEILALSPRNNEAPNKIKDLDDKIIKYKEKQAYFPNIEIRDVRIGKSILDEVGVFGEIKNKGDKSLKKVEITTYCLDKDGKTVFEKTYHPILVTESSFGLGGNKPLKPNYGEQFGYKLNDAPSDWSGQVRVEVTDLEFE